MNKRKEVLNTIGRAILFGMIALAIYVSTLFLPWPFPDTLGFSRIFVVSLASKIIEEQAYILIRSKEE